MGLKKKKIGGFNILSQTKFGYYYCWSSWPAKAAGPQQSSPSFSPYDSEQIFVIFLFILLWLNNRLFMTTDENLFFLFTLLPCPCGYFMNCDTHHDRNIQSTSWLRIFLLSFCNPLLAGSQKQIQRAVVFHVENLRNQ